MRRETGRLSHTQTHTVVANIYFASAMPHAKCNKWSSVLTAKGAMAKAAKPGVYSALKMTGAGATAAYRCRSWPLGGQQ